MKHRNLLASLIKQENIHFDGDVMYCRGKKTRDFGSNQNFSTIKLLKLGKVNKIFKLYILN